MKVHRPNTNMKHELGDDDKATGQKATERKDATGLSRCARTTSSGFYRSMRMHKRGPGVRPSVRLSVTFVSCAKTNEDIFEIFSPRGS